MTLRFRVTDKSPAPGGDVIRISGPAAGYIQTGDRLVYEIRIGTKSPAFGFHVSPLYRRHSLFQSHGFVDQNGQTHAPGYSYADARGRWVQRTVGLANACPRPFVPLALVLQAAKRAVYEIGLRNLRVLRRDGTTVPYWTGGPPDVQLVRGDRIEDLVVDSPFAPREIDPATFKGPGMPMAVVTENAELKVERTTVDGVQAWVSRSRNDQGKLTFFYLQAPEQMRHGRVTDAVLTLVYRDVGGVAVHVVYDGEDRVWQRAGGFTLGNGREWRTVTLRLPKPRFEGRCNGHDVRLNIMRPSQDPVLVAAYLSGGAR